MARYASNASLDGENRKEAADRAWRLEQRGRLSDDGSVRAVHPDEAGDLPIQYVVVSDDQDLDEG